MDTIVKIIELFDPHKALVLVEGLFIGLVIGWIIGYNLQRRD